MSKLTHRFTAGMAGIGLEPGASGARPLLAGRWLCVLVIALSASSCAGAGGGVPSLASGSTSGEATDSGALAARQRGTAAALAECLADLGVKANVSDPETTDGPEKGFVMVIPILDGPSYLIVTPEGASISTEDYPAPIDISSPRLVSGDRDLTEEYLACIESSGYFIPEVDGETDPREEEIEKQEEAEAGVIWAECARANGLPNIADPEVVVDGFATRPEVLIPASVTVEQFKVLLEDCPPFDPDRDLAHGNMYEADEEMPTDPVIGFELPEGDPLREGLQAVLDDFTVQAYEDARG
ncbi:MAG: hypothetical protein LBL01_01590 [Bifidobacteriaceae bacterium]|jgi:hypothetical protein|nr:hypothetical protein [Bifidobacteriaceae bacterium]